jgi:predicted helicase
MRQQLMQSFSEIYLLNLHGNAKKKEVCPDGSKDENVFDIQQGVAIGLFVKTPGSPGPARVHYADLWGNREGKNQALAQMEFITTTWRELQPRSPFYLFVPQDMDLRAEYGRGWPVHEIFPVNSVGIVTARDNLTIHWTRQGVMDTVKDFARLDPETAREKYHLGKDARDWKVELAQKDLRTSGLKEQLVTPVLYRPFDARFTYYTAKTRGFICMPRPEVMGHILVGENLGLCGSRSVETGRWEHLFCSRSIIQHHTVSLKEVNYLFPLYLYHTVFGQVNRTPNINPVFIKDLSGKVGLAFVPEGRGDLQTTMGPEDVFSYAYAVFHSPIYRQRYSEFLKGDFPRLPLTGNKALFTALVGLGAEMVSLHLMESPRLENFITRFPVTGPQVVEGVRYEDSARRVYINSEQYFEGIPPDVWAFTIGGYQVCHKWLKDRKGRTLSFEDLHHYQRIVVALAETIRLMGEIDAAIDAHGGWPIDLGHNPIQL